EVGGDLLLRHRQSHRGRSVSDAAGQVQEVRSDAGSDIAGGDGGQESLDGGEPVRERAQHPLTDVGVVAHDAPALATANIGVAMGAAGSAVAVETADIALMGDNLLKLPEAIGLAKRTVSVMRQNITIALITVVLLLAGVFDGGVRMSAGVL